MTHNPVIFIPGIMGSRLYDQEGDLVWVEYSLKLTKLGEMMRIQNPLFVKNNEKDLAALSEDEREYGAMGAFEYPYKKIIDRLCAEFPKRGVYFFSYDFRQSKKDTAKLLDQQIRRTLHAAGASGADLIAHSLGGLIVSAYLGMFGSDTVGKIMTLATPYEGTPDIINTALTGELTYIPGGLFDAVTKITRDVRTSFPSGSDLIPTMEYFSRHPMYHYTKNIPVNDEMPAEDSIPDGEPYYLPAGQIRDAGVNVYEPMTPKEYAMTLQHIFSDGNVLRLENDSRTLPELDRSYFAVGINHQTIRSLIFSDDPNEPEITHIIYDHAGDGCVPTDSATMFGHLEKLGKDPQGNERLLKTEAEHGAIVNHDPVIDWIIAVLSEKTAAHIRSDPVITDKPAFVKPAGRQEILAKLQKLMTTIKNQKKTP